MRVHQLGATIEVTTVLDETIRGVVFGYSPNSEVIAIQTSPGDQLESANFRIVNAAFVKKTRVLKNTKPVFIKLKPISDKKVKHRVQQAESLLEISMSNPGASAVARNLFRHFLIYFDFDQVKWKGNDIELKSSVRISRPYSLQNVKEGRDSEVNDLARRALKEFWLSQVVSDRGG